MQGLPIEYLLISQEWIKLRFSNFIYTFVVWIGSKAHYKFREK